MNTNTLGEITNLRNRVLENLNSTINDRKIFDAFLKDTYIYSIEGSKMLVVCGSALSKAILQDKYKGLIDTTVNDVSGTDFEVIFASKDEIENKQTTKITSENPSNFFKSCILDPHFTFDNFVVGPSNKEASQAGLIVASSPAKLYNPLFIYGESGLGKTHLLNAIGNYIKSTITSFKILYVTAQDFLYQYLDYVNQTNKNEDLSKYIKTFDVLLLDDVQMLKDKKKTLEFFFDIYQYFLQNKKQIVLTSDRLPSELEGIDTRLVSRFMDGLTVQVTRPDSAMCAEILKKKIVGAGMKIEEFDDDVIAFVAEKFKGSMRELNGALNRMIFIKNIHHAEHVDMNLASEALSNMVDVSDVKGKVTETKILNVVSSYYNLNSTQLTGKLKTGQIAMVRHIAIYLIRDIMDLPLKKIGDIFGGRDHTTIMHSITKVEEMLKEDKQTKAVINELKTKINGK